MKNFVCTHCGNKSYFENVLCLNCNRSLGFHVGHLSLIALDPADGQLGVFYENGTVGLPPLKYCDNFQHGTCNWLTEAHGPQSLCLGCDLNRTIPNLTEPGNLESWRELERAKKRLVYSLLRFRLPLDGAPYGEGKLQFDFLKSAQTGHLDGLITINLKEADSVERERTRKHFAEPYRTLLGHLRHESGHFYWNVLIQSRGRQNEFAALFGDPTQDYGEALKRYHDNGPTPGWESNVVSAYASAHPWEDWAETWAHYIHMVDALDTAEAEGVEPRAVEPELGAPPPTPVDLYREETIDNLIARWIPLTVAMNRLSRSMDHDDFYPFVIPPPAIQKLGFVHDAIRGFTP